MVMFEVEHRAARQIRAAGHDVASRLNCWSVQVHHWNPLDHRKNATGAFQDAIFDFSARADMERRGGEIEPPAAIGAAQDVERVYSHVARARDRVSLTFEARP